MAFDIDAYLADFNYSAEELTQAKALFGKPERVKLLEGNQLRQSDYSRAQNELKKANDELIAKDKRLAAEAAEWATLSASEREASKGLRDRIAKHEHEALVLRQRIEAIATDAGLDPKKALEGIEQAPPPKKEEPPPVDLSKYVPREQFGSMSEYLFTLATELPALAAEHLELTGKPLDTRALRAEIQRRSADPKANLDPRTVWEELNSIPTVRDTRAKEKYDADIKAAESRGFERARTEAALPVPPSMGGNRAPVLRTADGNARESVLKRPQPESGVQAAAGALAALRAKNEAAAAAGRK